MTLSDAIAAFREYSRIRAASAGDVQLSTHDSSLDLLARYASVSDPELTLITSGMLRDFIGRWCVEEAMQSTPDDFVSPAALAGALASFFQWADEQAGTRLIEWALPVLAELEQSLPRALEISRALVADSAKRVGPFTFPEFLTSFEDGGHSEYDIGAGGQPAALEGYFRVVRVEGCMIEMEDLISGQTVWPVLFSEEVARLLPTGYILNLEIVRVSEGWRIVDAGLAYPPGTQVV